MDLQVKVFIDTAKGGGKFETKSRLLKRIKEALVKARIEIPVQEG